MRQAAGCDLGRGRDRAGDIDRANAAEPGEEVFGN
jgi:hypothetical protein